MQVFEMVVIIVAIYFIYKVITDLSQHKSAHKSDISDLDERLTKIEGLEKRIQVLEKIVTDKNYDLKDKIDSL
ncbi:MAG: hypothetical protein KJO69_06625 [Gammaproteobacteria bacterium]|nr:hypothetical protein [Gammaproteobacteria bacterium]NNJ71568.1 hypothetical protein [Enterobacterales bacterium]